MSEEKFAVYIVMVDDSEQADTKLASEVYSAERLGGNLTWSEAEEVLQEADKVNWDRAE